MPELPEVEALTDHVRRHAIGLPIGRVDVAALVAQATRAARPRCEEAGVELSIHVEDGTEQARAKKVLERHGATDIVTAGEESVPTKAAVQHRHA